MQLTDTVSVENFEGYNFRGFSIVIQKLNFVVFVVATFNYKKVPSIGKIETKIENGEDWRYQYQAKPHRSISPVAASQLVSRAANDNALSDCATYQYSKN